MLKLFPSIVAWSPSGGCVYFIGWLSVGDKNDGKGSLSVGDKNRGEASAVGAMLLRLEFQILSFKFVYRLAQIAIFVGWLTLPLLK